MTAITISGLGYGEVRPLDDAGRALAVVVLVGGVTAMGIWFALITSTIVEMDISARMQERRLMKALDRLEDHVIVCGGGRMGRQIVKELSATGVPYVVLETHEDSIARVREIDADALILRVDATRDEHLHRAGITRARGLIAALSADTDNLFVCLSANGIKPELEIVARAYEDEARKKMLNAGADHVVNPLQTGGHHMVALMFRPHVLSFLDVIASNHTELELLLEQVEIPEPSSVAGLALRDAQIQKKTGLVVLAIESGNGAGPRFVYNPGPDETLRSGDSLIVLGESGQIDRLRAAVA
jgi:voltage-gated potassium channel